MNLLRETYEDIIKAYEIFLANAKELKDEGTERFWQMKINHLKQKMES